MTANTSAGSLLKQLRDLEVQHARAKEELIAKVEQLFKAEPQIRGVQVLSEQPFCAVVRSTDLLRGRSSWAPATYDAQGQYAAVIEALKRLPLERAVNVLRELAEVGWSASVKFRFANDRASWMHPEIMERLKQVLDDAGLYRFIRIFIRINYLPESEVWEVRASGQFTEDDEQSLEAETPHKRPTEAQAMSLAITRAKTYLKRGRTKEVTISVGEHEKLRLTDKDIVPALLEQAS